jgi:hypothetical protein
MSDPDGKDARILTFGVHGNNNTPNDVREVASRISIAVGRTTDGANLQSCGARESTLSIRDIPRCKGGIGWKTTTGFHLRCAGHLENHRNDSGWNARENSKRQPWGKPG